MTWMQTHTGVQFWPLTPRAEDVRLGDIAHALSLQCRFNGHCREFYSVAQHSVHVAHALLASGALLDHGQATIKNVFRLALLHDAGEAYLPDVARPLKSSWPGFASIEAEILRCVHIAVGVESNPELDLAIKHCDDVLLATEARDLMGPPPSPWEALPPPLQMSITPWSPEHAEYVWRGEWMIGPFWPRGTEDYEGVLSEHEGGTPEARVCSRKGKS